jgi:prepilin-type N-terminal cleavage/methylation domain-containing protein
VTSATLNTSRRTAFTLIELLIVIGVIVLLAAITLAVGPRLLDSRRESVTEQIITALDGMLETYITERQGNIPPDINNTYVELWEDVRTPVSTTELWTSDVERARSRYGNMDMFPPPDADDRPWDIVHTVGSERFPLRPSSSMFLYQARGITDIDTALGQMPASRLTQVFGEDSEGNPFDLTAVLDAWGNADRPYERHILYVHPANQRAQQLYGYCQNNRPYFLSAGADGVYGTIQDLSVARRKQITNNIAPFDSDDRVVEFFRKSLEDNITSYEVRPALIADDAALQKNPSES